MRRRVVAGNWKMHGSTATIERLLDALVQLKVPNTDVLVFPPIAYLSTVIAADKG